MNPMGKNNAIMSAQTRELQRKVYKSRFDKVLLRENGAIKYTLYYDKDKNTYWAHIKTPSESVNKFYYDVVFKFYTDAKGGNQQDLFKWYFNVFSNDPAFVFTYAYVFNQNKLLIPELLKKMSAQAIKEKPKEKNEKEIVGYDKIIYFAYLILEMRNLNKLKLFKNEAILLSPKKILSEVDNADDKIEDRQSQKVSKRKRPVLDEKQYSKLKRDYGINDNNVRVNVKTTRKVTKIKASGAKSNGIRKVRKVKKK